MCSLDIACRQNWRWSSSTSLESKQNTRWLQGSTSIRQNTVDIYFGSQQPRKRRQRTKCIQWHQRMSMTRSDTRYKRILWRSWSNFLQGKRSRKWRQQMSHYQRHKRGMRCLLRMCLRHIVCRSWLLPLEQIRRSRKRIEMTHC
jgi:hypothetical protein